MSSSQPLTLVTDTSGTPIASDFTPGVGKVGCGECGASSEEKCIEEMTALDREAAHPGRVAYQALLDSRRKRY